MPHSDPDVKKKYHREYYLKNRDKQLAAEKLRYETDPEFRQRKLDAWKRTNENELQEVTMLRHSRNRARKMNLDFNLEISDIIIPSHCPLLEIPLFKGTLKFHANSPTLDRIIPELGYVKGNVWVISHRANVMKNDASFTELQMFRKNLGKLLD